MTTSPPHEIPPLSPTFRHDLHHKLGTMQAERLRLILQQTSDANNDFATTLHKVLCLDPASARSKGIDASTESNEDNVDQSAGDTEAVVVDLTGADSDKENDVASSSSTRIGTKRKADDDSPIEIGATTLKKQRSTGTLGLSRGGRNMHFREQYKHCMNCYELFDTLSEPCHDHEQGPTRAPGPRERVGLGGPADDDSVDEEDSDEEDYCECLYHPGFLELDWEAEGDNFPDHDERIHGTIDSDEMRLQQPEAFVWNCCDQSGSADGCKMGRHKFGPGLLMYARLARTKGS